MPGALLLSLASATPRPVVVQPLRRQAGLLPHQLLLQSEVEDSLLASAAEAAAEGRSPATSARADWARSAMVYLGQDRVFTYNQWSGEYASFQYERHTLGKCDAFSWPPLGSGRFEQLLGVEWVFLGFTKGQYLTQLLHLDPLTGHVELADCDDASFAPGCEGQPLSCKPLALANSQLPGGAGSVHELVYLGQDLLLHYDRTHGRYALLRYDRCSHDLSPGGCALGLSAPLANGTLAPGEYHTYLGYDLVLAYAPREGGRYSVLRLFRGGVGDADAGAGANASGAAAAAAAAAAREAGLVQVATGTLSFERSWSSDPRRHRFAALREAQLLDYDREEAHYRVLQLDPVDMSEGMVGELRYTLAAGGAGTVPVDASDACSVHATAAACLQAAQLSGQCGWCQAAQQCRRGDARGPCARGNCQAPPEGCGLWHTPAARIVPDNNGAGALAPAAAAAAAAAAVPSPAAAAPVEPTAAAAPTNAGLGATLNVPLPVAAAFTQEGSALWSMAAFALRALQQRGCAGRAEAACDVLRDARLSRILSATSLVAYDPTAADANGTLAPAASTAAATGAGAAAGSVVYALRAGLCTADGADGGAEDALALTLVEDVDGAALVLTAAAVRVLSSTLPLPPSLPMGLDRAELRACSAAPSPCWPAGGDCAPPAVAPPAFDAHEFTYIGYDALLDAAPLSGALRIWQLDRRPSGAAPILTPPLTSTVWGAPLRRFVFVGYDTWLDYSPGSGSYALQRCEHERWQRGAPLLCAQLCGGSCGAAPELADQGGAKQLLYLGHDRLLVFVTATGAYSLVALHRTPSRAAAAAAASLDVLEAAASPAPSPAAAPRAAPAGGVGVGFAAPLARGNLPEWAGRQLAYLGDELLLATDMASGAHDWWLLATNSSGPLPRARVGGGVWDVGTNGNGTRLTSLMEDRLLRTAPDGRGGVEYSLLQCARPACDGAGLPRGEVACTALGAGALADGGAAAAPSLRAPSRAAGPRQLLLLESGAAGVGWPGGGAAAGARYVLDYEARSARVRILGLELAPPRAAPPALGAAYAAAADAATCDALPQPPAYSTAWPFEGHRLTALGNDTVLDTDPRSGEYRVWACDRAAFAAAAAPPAPLAAAGLPAGRAAAADEPPAAALPCAAVASGAWPALALFSEVLWLGPLLGSRAWLAQRRPLDALLLWEPSTGRYEAWSIRRSGRRWLPSAVARPVAAGSWEALVGHSLVYLGSATLLALHPTTGAYQVRFLDRGALQPSSAVGGVPPPMETGLLATGSLGELPAARGAGGCDFGHHQPTALGDDLILDLEPTTGAYCVLRLGREQLAQQPPLTRVAGGNLLRRPCDHDTCGACALEPGCGWCSESNTCQQGGPLAPCGGGCHDHWTQGYCADWPCEHYATCDDCLNTKLCGWCEGLGACMPGSDVQPLALACPAGYSYQYCPATAEAGAITVGTSDSV